MSKFVSYLRVSTSKQGARGLGIEAQREAVRRYVDPIGTIAEFVEVESGRSDKNRPQLQKALAECKRRKATLIIAKLDRLARNVFFISGLLETGVEFVACDNPHANKMTIQLLAVFAEFEREQISTRIKAALERAKAKGTKLGNPRWQEALAKAQQAANPTPPDPVIVELIYRQRSAGMTLQAIADHLNHALRLRTPKDRQWYPSSVSNYLRLAPEALREAA